MMSTAMHANLSAKSLGFIQWWWLATE
jgi:hypothetical protein